MSMDEAMTALRAFQLELDRLNETLAASAAALRRSDEQLRPLWNDAFSRSYQRRWDTFEQQLGGYLSTDAPRYRAFVQTRIAALDRYLDRD